MSDRIDDSQSPGRGAGDSTGTGGAGRRRLLQLGLAGGAAALSGCGGGGGTGPAVHTSQRVRWRLASSFPSSLDAMFGSAELLARRVAAMSGGNFELRCYEAGEIVPALNVLDAVQSGSVQVGQTASYYYIGKNPALAFDTCVPFGLTPRQQQAWLRQAGGLELTRELYADFGAVNFPAGSTGVQMGGWFREPVGGPEDLRGLKMRIPGLGGEVMNALGVLVQNIGGAEIYSALENKTIDATEWVGPYDDEKLGFYQVAKNYLYPGWWEPGPELSFVVNAKAWAALPAEYREMFEVATNEAAIAMTVKYDAENPAALERLIGHGVQVEPFEDSLMQAARAASEDLLSSAAASDAGYARILEHWRAFRTSAFRWFGTAEFAYARTAFGGGR
ncbi:TRAP transporter substrate-binding protein DctP [Engelhardtia mirabilis]|uniref:Monocarboxylate 2-oxoacid-binding periplasmic protein n=1 Tax=Engelhardtia mirabilis TaxID=2528011 RepID=A0A518BEW7_9BACT|nr:Monocarboxylate 2-oxoacid-binding periplasmic protein precursor [Planctomycetes bacterium Pla133]QDU99847.1 Monocarboxylate 2-oxoacid-binding periplasmic protein precursor [Planctomycetes bacterium Pla86]